MLSEIEQFILGGNQAHDLISLSKQEGTWILKVSPCYDHETIKVFEFLGVIEKYEQLLFDEGETLEFPLPIIGFDCECLPNKKWKFCLNVSDIEWGFTSEWPKCITN